MIPGHRRAAAAGRDDQPVVDGDRAREGARHARAAERHAARAGRSSSSASCCRTALIGLVDVVLVLSVAVLWFEVPMRGSVLLLFGDDAASTCSARSASACSCRRSPSTQQQAMMTTTFFFLMPMVYLSGFVFPIENMPAVDPAAHLSDSAALLPRHPPRDLPEGRRPGDVLAGGARSYRLGCRDSRAGDDPIVEAPRVGTLRLPQNRARSAPSRCEHARASHANGARRRAARESVCGSPRGAAPRLERLSRHPLAQQRVDDGVAAAVAAITSSRSSAASAAWTVDGPPRRCRVRTSADSSSRPLLEHDRAEHGALRRA